MEPASAHRALASVWLRVVGGAAAARAVPVWTGVAALVAVLFGGTGMRAEDLTRAALGSPRFAAGLAVTWLVLIVPAGRALLDPARTAYLRALPGPRGLRGAITAAVALVAQLPWTVLWAAGDGAAAGAVATVGAAVAMVVVAEAAGRIPWPRRAPRWRGTVRALLGVHRRLLLRGRGAAVVRAAGIAWLGGAAAGLVARTNQMAGDEALWWSLFIAAVALPVAVGALALPVVEDDRRLGWLLRAAGCSWGERVAGAALTLTALGAGMGVVAAAACALIAAPTPGDAAVLAGWLAALGAGIGACALRAGTWAARVEGGAGRVVTGMMVIALGVFLAIGFLAVSGVVVVAAVGLGGALALAGRRPEEQP
jgi:hypothetical protein